MPSSPIDEEKTTSSRSRRKTSKDPETSRCFPKSETTMHSLSQNATTFIDLFYYHQIGMVLLIAGLDLSSYLTLHKQFIRVLMMLGLINVFLLCGIVACIAEKNYVETTILICLLPIAPVLFAFVYWFKKYENLREINLNMQEFRDMLFWMVVELGKLKQRCEDLKGSLRPGLEKGNLKRLERDIVNLLDTMEKLEDTATEKTIGRVEADYRFLFSRLEMMTVSLRFYTSDDENDEI